LSEAGQGSDDGSNTVSKGGCLDRKVLSGGSGEAAEELGNFGEFSDEHKHV
jgi:hypothetical protein